MSQTMYVRIPGALTPQMKRPASALLVVLLQKLVTADRRFRERRHVWGLPDYLLDDLGLNRSGAPVRPAHRSDFFL